MLFHVLRGIFLSFVVCLSASAFAEPIKIVALGDSLMAGFGLERGEGFVPRLEAVLRARGHDVLVQNAGVSGDTTSGGLARLDWSVGPDADAVIVELGANDMLRGLSPEFPAKNLDEIVRRLSERGLAVLVAGMRAGPNLGAEYGEEFNAIFPAAAKKYDALLYPFFLDGVAGNATLNLDDGLHPTAEGIELIVEKILPSVEALIARAKAT